MTVLAFWGRFLVLRFNFQFFKLTLKLVLSNSVNFSKEQLGLLRKNAQKSACIHGLARSLGILA
jgi:hypothetical protein